MKSTQAWYWLAAGVLALGLNNIYHDGSTGRAHWRADLVADRVIDRSGGVVEMFSEQADRLVAKAQMMVARDETASCRLATAVAQFETKMTRTENGFARVEALSARQEAALARLAANRARIEAQTVRVQVATGVFKPMALQSVKSPVVCPRVRVSVPRMPMVKIPVPVVRV